MCLIILCTFFYIRIFFILVILLLMFKDDQYICDIYIYKTNQRLLYLFWFGPKIRWIDEYYEVTKKMLYLFTRKKMCVSCVVKEWSRSFSTKTEHNKKRCKFDDISFIIFLWCDIYKWKAANFIIGKKLCIFLQNSNKRMHRKAECLPFFVLKSVKFWYE